MHPIIYMNTEQLLKIIKSESGKFLSSRMTEKYMSQYPELLKEIYDNTDFYSNEEIIFSRRILLIVNSINSRINCSVCGCDVDPNKTPADRKTHFLTMCSSSCSGKSRAGAKVIRTEDRQSEINSKREKTMIEKYGVAYNSQRNEVKKNSVALKKKTHSHIRYDILEDEQLLVEMYGSKPSTYIAEICNCDYSVVLGYLKKYGVDVSTQHTKTSKQQLIVADIFRSFGVEPVLNNKILGDFDIDVFSPDHNFGVEYNGFPWHLEEFSGRGKTYHVNKANLATDQKIRLLQITPFMLENQRALVTRMIGYALGCGEKFYARKCILREIDTETAKQFLDVNHLHGYVGANIKLGLYCDDALVHVMTFVKSRYDKSSSWEIARSASSCIVVGAVSKCIKYFKDRHMTIGETLITYADRSVSEGKSYLLSGMKFSHATEPNYWYTRDKHTLESRVKFQKHKLKNLLDEFDESKTEWENMKSAKYDRYWDCGNNVYKLTK